MVHRSRNAHLLGGDSFPFIARLWREPPFSSVESAELRAAADRIAGPNGWRATAGWRGDAGCRRYRFATPGQAEEMQVWLDASGIKDRPPPPAWDGPQLTVAGGPRKIG